MSNRLAIDPSEIRIPDYAEIKRRLWSRSPSRQEEDTSPVVKVVKVDFSDEETPVVAPKPVKPVPKEMPKRAKAAPPALVEVVKRYRLAYASPRAYRRPLKQILKGIARVHHVSVGALTGRNLDKRICDARQHAYYAIATECCDISYPEIARRFSDRHHTTIIYGASAFAARHGLPPVVAVMSNPNFVNRVVHIIRRLPVLPDNAPHVHAAILEAMNADGLLVFPEYWVKFGEEKWGRIDLVVRNRNLSAAIEIDCRRPRGKSLLKLKAFNGARVLVLRGIAGRVDIEGIDAVVPVRVRLESRAEEADKAAVGRAYDRIRGRA